MKSDKKGDIHVQIHDTEKQSCQGKYKWSAGRRYEGEYVDDKREDKKAYEIINDFITHFDLNHATPTTSSKFLQKLDTTYTSQRSF